MLTLGFTSKYYTLWNVTSEIRYSGGSVINGNFTGDSYNVTNHIYIQNLSMNYDEAIKKITERAGAAEWVEALDLKGQGSFRTETFIPREVQQIPEYCFTFGRLSYTDMRTSDDIWQLQRAVNQEVTMRGRVYARKRLIELGELTKYEWFENLYNAESEKWFPVKRKWATLRQIERFEQEKKSKHYFNEGDKVEVEVKIIKSFSFEGAFGTTFIQIYETKNNEIIKYMGSKPPAIAIDNEGFTKIKGTVKHDFYNGLAETKLQRIKVIN